MNGGEYGAGVDTGNGNLGSVIDVDGGEHGSGVDSGSGSVGSGIDVDGGEYGSGIDTGSLNDDQSEHDASDALPAWVIAPASSGASVLTVDDGDALAALTLPFIVRIGVGSSAQEDLTVTEMWPLHGDGSDGRYSLRFAAPSRYAHVHGERLHHVELPQMLSTRFKVHWQGAHLFDAFVRGPDVPHLHGSTEPLALITINASAAGLAVLAEPAHRAVASTSAAIFGWASYSFENASFAAATVAILLSPFRGVLSRGRRATASRPLVGALDLQRGRGYWSNVTEEQSGWVARLELADDLGAAYVPLRTRLVSAEVQRFGVGPILPFDSTLYARYTPTSEQGFVLPELPSEPQPEWARDDVVLLEYEVG